jgi:hypothetical protein
LLTAIQAQLTTQAIQLADQAKEMRAVRESVIRLETHGYGEQLSDARKDIKSVRDKVIVLETQGKFFSGGIAAAVAVITSVLTAMILKGMA